MMPRFRRTMALVAFVSLVLVVSFTVELGRREPRYQDHTLQQWLQDLPNVPNESIRIQGAIPGSASDALQRMGPGAVRFLVSMVNERNDPIVDKIKMALNRQQNFIFFRYQRGWDDQIDALKGLSALGPLAKPAIPSIVKLIREDQNSERALFTLARIGPDAIPVLIQSLQNTNWLTRSRAAGYLSNFKEYGEIVVPALLPGLDDPDEGFVITTATSLGGFGRMARPAFPKLLRLARDRRYEQTSVYALMAIDCEGALQNLLDELQSTNAQARAQTASSLRWFGSRGRPAVPALLKCLTDGDQRVRAAAVIALGEIGEEPDLVVPALFDNLNGGDMMLRTWNVIALASFGERAKPAVPVILNLIEQQKTNDFYRAELQRALEKIDPEKAAPFVHSQPEPQPRRPPILANPTPTGQR